MAGEKGEKLEFSAVDLYKELRGISKEKCVESQVRDVNTVIAKALLLIAEKLDNL